MKFKFKFGVHAAMTTKVREGDLFPWYYGVARWHTFDKNGIMQPRILMMIVPFNFIYRGWDRLVNRFCKIKHSIPRIDKEIMWASQKRWEDGIDTGKKFGREELMQNFLYNSEEFQRRLREYIDGRDTFPSLKKAGLIVKDYPDAVVYIKMKDVFGEKTEEKEEEPCPNSTTTNTTESEPV